MKGSVRLLCFTLPSVPYMLISRHIKNKWSRLKYTTRLARPFCHTKLPCLCTPLLPLLPPFGWATRRIREISISKPQCGFFCTPHWSSVFIAQAQLSLVNTLIDTPFSTQWRNLIYYLISFVDSVSIAGPSISASCVCTLARRQGA